MCLTAQLWNNLPDFIIQNIYFISEDTSKTQEDEEVNIGSGSDFNIADLKL